VANEYDWTLPYLVSGAQYGGYAHPDKVAYCVDLTAPTIARVDKEPYKRGGLNSGSSRPPSGSGGRWRNYVFDMADAPSGFNAGAIVPALEGGGGGGSAINPRSSFSIDESNDESVIFANNSKNPAFQEIYYDADKYLTDNGTQYDEPIPELADNLYNLAGENERLAKTIAYALYKNQITTLKNLAKENMINDYIVNTIRPKINSIFSDTTVTLSHSEYSMYLEEIFPDLVDEWMSDYNCLTLDLIETYGGKTNAEINSANLTNGQKTALINYKNLSSARQRNIVEYLKLRDIEYEFFYDANGDEIEGATIDSDEFDAICGMIISAILGDYKLDPLPYSYGEIQQLVWNNNYWSKDQGGYGQIGDYAEFIPNMHGSSFYDTVEYNDTHEVTPYIIIGYEEYISPKTGEKKTRRIGRGGKVDDHDMVIAEQYATWAYQVLGDDNRIDLQFYPYKDLELETDSNKELTVEVDQETKSYLVGPYLVDLLNDAGQSISHQHTCNGNGTQEIADFIFSEMAGEQSGVKTLDEAFATGTFKLNIWNRGDTEPTVYSTPKKHDGINMVFDMETNKMVEAGFSRLFVENQNNAGDYENFYTEPRTETFKVNGIDVTENFKETNRIVITDANGKALDYAFPKFGQEFYIRYYPEDFDTKTLEYIQPSLYFRYLDGHFRVSATGYASTGIRFSASRAVMWNASGDNTVLSRVKETFDAELPSRKFDTFKELKSGANIGGIFYNKTAAYYNASNLDYLVNYGNGVSTAGLRDTWIHGIEKAVGKSNFRERDADEMQVIL
jgi:hypothetical protein